MWCEHFLNYSHEVPNLNLIRRFGADFIQVSVVLFVLYRRMLGQYFETSHDYLLAIFLSHWRCLTPAVRISCCVDFNEVKVQSKNNIWTKLTKGDSRFGNLHNEEIRKVYIHHYVLLGWTSQEKWVGRDLQHAWKKLRDFRKFWSGTQKDTGPKSLRGLVIGRGRNTVSDFKK